MLLLPHLHSDFLFHSVAHFATQNTRIMLHVCEHDAIVFVTKLSPFLSLIMDFDYKMKYMKENLPVREHDCCNNFNKTYQIEFNLKICVDSVGRLCCVRFITTIYILFIIII